MSKGSIGREKLLLLREIFLRETDAAHALRMEELLLRLQTAGFNAERKSLYKDFAVLRAHGLDICSLRSGGTTRYYLGQRDFELAELKMLIDGVQAARFLTEKKAAELIEKLSCLCSEHDAKRLQRELYVSGRVRNMDESIFVSVDKIHAAIGTDADISFRYLSYRARAKKVYRRRGERYCVSPYALICAQDNYYLLAYVAAEGIFKHYRVDKMEHIQLCEGSERQGKDEFAELDLAKYVDACFSMYSGREENILLRFDSALLPVFADRFGDALCVEAKEGGFCRAHIRAAVSPQFYGWLFGLSGEVVILEPEGVAEEWRERLRLALEAQAEVES
ncbi:MAG: WYL domain-containing protein [Clostridiales bacterium]|nr:WYL domain-containing protein [Clostridiales bacterium]